jgi:copper transport protein
LAAVALLGVGTALAASGHASAAQPQYLTRPAVFIHTVTIAFWIGALVPLAVALRNGSGAVPLHRFSAAIPFALAPLLFTGVLLAIIQVGKRDALWQTDYGHVFLVKLALVSLLLLMAAGNRWRLTKRAQAGEEIALRRLAFAIFLEFAFAVAVLGTVATWRFTPPPRALAAAAALPASVHIHTEKAMAQVTLTPGHAGPVAASIELLTGDLGPLPAKEVTLTLSNPQIGIEPIKRSAIQVDDLHWQVDNLVIPTGGSWNVEVTILISEFDLIRLHDKIDIRH